MNETTMIVVEQSRPLMGSTTLSGAKNAVLVIIASLILTRGKSILKNVPRSDDVLHMIELLESLGASAAFHSDDQMLAIDTTNINEWHVSPDAMKKMRASILVMGPLLARFGKACVAFPGGCVIGSRPIDYHLKSFMRMGAAVVHEEEFFTVQVEKPSACTIVLEYPSVGATENVMMLAVATPGTTIIMNASLEPEVCDLITVLRSMGARILVQAPATLLIEGVDELGPIVHDVMPDRLEAGALLLAAAATGGSVYITNAIADHLTVFLMKLEEMGHLVTGGPLGKGISLTATKEPRAVSFKTAPYPGFPTDLQAPMMAMQCLARGTSIIEETVFENRFMHVRELQKMGAQITMEHCRVTVQGVDELFGAHLIASDIRASCALVIAGLCARGTTIIKGVRHFTRGYDQLDKKLRMLGARVTVHAIKEGEND